MLKNKLEQISLPLVVLVAEEVVAVVAAAAVVAAVVVVAVEQHPILIHVPIEQQVVVVKVSFDTLCISVMLLVV
jgi:hypothetical protein